MLNKLDREEIVVKNLTNMLTELKAVCNIGPFPSRLEKSEVLLVNKIISSFIPKNYHLIMDFKYPEKADDLLDYLKSKSIVCQTLKTRQALLDLFNVRDLITHIIFVCSQRTLTEVMLRFWPGITFTEFSFYIVPNVVTVERWIEGISKNDPHWARRLGVLYELHQSGDLYFTVNLDPMREVDVILQQVAKETGIIFSTKDIVVRPLTLMGKGYFTTPF